MPAGNIATGADGARPKATVAQQRFGNGGEAETGAGRGTGGRFAPGNTFGFKPGQSGNPTGPKPGSRIFQQVVNEMLLEGVPGDITGRPWVRMMIEKAFVEVLKGSAPHLALVWKFTGEGETLKLKHEGEVTVITPEQAEAKRQARWAQVAPALALAGQMAAVPEEAGALAVGPLGVEEDEG